MPIGFSCAQDLDALFDAQRDCRVHLILCFFIPTTGHRLSVHPAVFGSSCQSALLYVGHLVQVHPTVCRSSCQFALLSLGHRVSPPSCLWVIVCQSTPLFMGHHVSLPCCLWVTVSVHPAVCRSSCVTLLSLPGATVGQLTTSPV